VVKVKQPEEPRIERTETFNLDFEEGDPGDRVPGWREVVAGEYQIELVDENLDKTSLSEVPRRGAQVRILGYTPDDTVSETLITPLVMGTRDWTLFEASTAMPPNLENAVIAPNLWGKGKAWFDDIEVIVE